MRNLHGAVLAFCAFLLGSGSASAALVAGAETAATRQVRIGIESLGFSAGTIALPAAPAVPAASLQAGPAAAGAPSDELQAWAAWIGANGTKARVPAIYARKLALSNDDLILRSTKTFTGELQHNIYVTEVLGRTQILYSILNRAENKGVMFVMGIDGVYEKNCVVQNGVVWEIPAEDAKRDAENERALWRKQLAGIGNS